MRFVLGLVFLAPIFLLGLLALAPAVLNIWILLEARQSGLDLPGKAVAQGFAGMLMSLIPAAFLLVPALRRRTFVWTHDRGANALLGLPRLLLFLYVMWRFIGKFEGFEWLPLTPTLISTPF